MQQEPQVISAERAAFLIGITPRHLTRLVKDGWVKKTPDGKYTDAGTSQGYAAFLKDEARRGMRNTSTTELQNERAKMLQLRREQMAGTLMLVSEHEAILDGVVGVFRAGLSALPARISNDPAERRRVEGFTDDVLADVSARARKNAGELVPSSEPDDPDSTDDSGPVGSSVS